VPGPVGFGGFRWVVVVELLELVLVDVVVVVVLVVGCEAEDVVDEAGVWQDSLTLAIVPVTGRFSADTGVPGAAFTLNVRV
jgi:hypothetical protein